MAKKSTCCGSEVEYWNDGKKHCSKCGHIQG